MPVHQACTVVDLSPIGAWRRRHGIDARVVERGRRFILEVRVASGATDAFSVPGNCALAPDLALALLAMRAFRVRVANGSTRHWRFRAGYRSTPGTGAWALEYEADFEIALRLEALCGAQAIDQLGGLALGALDARYQRPSARS